MSAIPSEIERTKRKYKTKKLTSFLPAFASALLHQSFPPRLLLSSQLSFCNLSGEGGNLFLCKNLFLHFSAGNNNWKHIPQFGNNFVSETLEKEVRAGFLRQKLRRFPCPLSAPVGPFSMSISVHFQISVGGNQLLITPVSAFEWNDASAESWVDTMKGSFCTVMQVSSSNWR